MLLPTGRTIPAKPCRTESGPAGPPPTLYPGALRSAGTHCLARVRLRGNADIGMKIATEAHGNTRNISAFRCPRAGSMSIPVRAYPRTCPYGVLLTFPGSIRAFFRVLPCASVANHMLPVTFHAPSGPGLPATCANLVQSGRLARIAHRAAVERFNELKS
jgi:hypothetical protein